MPLSCVALGLDHRHIYGMTENMEKAGVECLGFWTKGTPETLSGYIKKFPHLKRFVSLEDALDCGADLALISAIPVDRAQLTVRAMHQGMDVMSDKPGCTTLGQLAEIKSAVETTGRIWSVNFSERFETPVSTRASELVAAGAIGKVVQTVGLGPHRLNRSTRPDWFFQREQFGGILTDIASHQIDQFLHYTGSDTAQITHAFTANYANQKDFDLQDFGEINLRSEQGTGYIRVDWFTPDALPTWGDGRLTILGTEGYLELRKYVDVGGGKGTDYLILVNQSKSEKIDASDAGLPYFSCLANDIQHRSETAMTQAHCFTVMELALLAQQMAELE
ncbi:MAG: Gfo/Idh/MocA family oxidoreductase [Planktomarina sp.]|mgnify:FL=1|nr:Gfo/Idh/MocA family oxidoreductase [Planktomarina sp.]|tara:strand:- start:347 stop:1348 length:1002 start_codon:yes stop_codon:yes gene_type:complete